MHGWGLEQVPEVPLPHTHTPRPAVSWAQSLALQAVGCRSRQANVVVLGVGGPLEGATAIKGGEPLITRCENNIPHTSTVCHRTQWGWGWEMFSILCPEAQRHIEGSP